MIENSTIKDYIELCHLFSSCLHRVQGPGGNISIKKGDEIIIKTSGVSLSDTSESYGYVVCDLPSLQEKYNSGNEDVLSCVVRGDSNKPPSLESFFHLLPFKIVVHIHPTTLLSYLCHKDAEKIIKERFPTAVFVPYTKPGVPLAKRIFELFRGETVFFLENHGIIVCSNESVDDICQLYSTIEDKLTYPYSKIQTERNYKKYLPEGFILKPCYSISPIDIPSSFPALTPDQSLFLKEKPFFLPTLDKESTILDTTSYSILVDSNFVYCIGKSATQCRWIEEILVSYLAILNIVKDSYSLLALESQQELLHCEKEKYRMNLK
jgi:ribulose-5-phosphate 4-epimerase/fuculose-1-phosphate aldolase